LFARWQPQPLYPVPGRPPMSTQDALRSRNIRAFNFIARRRPRLWWHASCLSVPRPAPSGRVELTPLGRPQPLPPQGWGLNTLRSESHRRRFAALSPATIPHPITEFSGHLSDWGFVEAGRGAMHEGAASRAERYRKEANKYGELAKQAEPGYLADVYRKVAVRYVHGRGRVERDRASSTCWLRSDRVADPTDARRCAMMLGTRKANERLAQRAAEQNAKGNTRSDSAGHNS
jgi:hypothetical protein